MDSSPPSASQSMSMGFEPSTDMEAHTDSMVTARLDDDSSSDKGLSPSPPTSPIKDDDIDDEDLTEEDRKRRRAAMEAIATIDAAFEGGGTPVVNKGGAQKTPAGPPDPAMKAHMQKQRERRNKEFQTLGVKVAWLREFINEHGGEEAFKGLTTGQVCDRFVRPKLLRMKMSYAEYLFEKQPQLTEEEAAAAEAAITKARARVEARRKKKELRANRESDDSGNDSDGDGEKTDEEAEFAEDQVPQPNVAEGQVMISHSWRNEFLQTVAAIEYHFKAQPELHLWIDLFCTDQTYTTKPLPEQLLPEQSDASEEEKVERNRLVMDTVSFQSPTSGMDYRWWALTYKSVIAHFGGVVLVMCSWRDPAVFRSCWCLYELYTSCTAADTDFEVAMTKTDSDTFIDEMSNNHQSYFAVLNKSVDILKAGAFHKYDKERILELVDKEVEGKFEGFNRIIQNRLKEWVMLTIESNVHARAEEAKLKIAHAAKVAKLNAEAAKIENEKRANLDKKRETDKQMMRADMMQEQQKYPAALKIYNRVLQRYKELEGEEGVNVASAYNNIGIVRFHIPESFEDGYDFGEIKELFDKSLAIKQKVLGQDHRNIAFIFANLASLHSKAGLFKEAIEYYMQALQIEERELAAPTAQEENKDKDKDKDKDKEGDNEFITKERPVNYEDVAQTLVHIAMAHLNTENDKDALEYYKRAAEVYQAAAPAQVDLHKGENGVVADPELNTELALVYYQIGDILQRRDASEEALGYFQQSLNIRRTLLGSHHYDVAHTLIQISDIHLHLEDEMEALSGYLQAKEIYTLLGMNVSQEMAHLLSSLAMAYEEKNDTMLALAAYQEALDTRAKLEEQESLPENHPEFKARKLAIADIYGHMGMLYDEDGRMDEAMNLYTQAIDLRRKYRLSKEDDAAQADILHNMSIVHRTRGKYIDALGCYLESLPILKKVLGGETFLEIAETYLNIGLMYRKLKEKHIVMDADGKPFLEGSDADAEEEDKEQKKNREEAEAARIQKEDDEDNAEEDEQLRFWNQKKRKEKREAEKEAKWELENEKRREMKEKKYMSAEDKPEWQNKDWTVDNIRESLTWFQKALGVKKRCQGENHPSVGGTHSNIANLHKLLKEYKEALEHYELDLKCSIRSFGADHPHIKSIHTNIEKMRKLVKSKEYVEELARKAALAKEETARLKKLAEDEESEYETDPEDGTEAATRPASPAGGTHALLDAAPNTPFTPAAPDTPAPSNVTKRPVRTSMVAASAAAAAGGGGKDDDSTATPAKKKATRPTIIPGSSNTKSPPGGDKPTPKRTTVVMPNASRPSARSPQEKAKAARMAKMKAAAMAAAKAAAIKKAAAEKKANAAAKGGKDDDSDDSDDDDGDEESDYDISGSEDENDDKAAKKNKAAEAAAVEKAAKAKAAAAAAARAKAASTNRAKAQAAAKAKAAAARAKAQVAAKQKAAAAKAAEAAKAAAKKKKNASDSEEDEEDDGSDSGVD